MDGFGAFFGPNVLRSPLLLASTPLILTFSAERDADRLRMRQRGVPRHSTVFSRSLTGREQDLRDIARGQAQKVLRLKISRRISAARKTNDCNLCIR